MGSNKKIVLVTGATGLIGSHVVERALAEGYSVRALVRENSTGRGFLSDLEVDQYIGDLCDLEVIEKAFENVDSVVHCAAKVGDWGDAVDYQLVNVDALETILEAAAKANVRRFVHISSLGVYEARDHKNTDETTAISLSGLDAYTKTKAIAEGLVELYSSCRGLSTVIIRPGFVYGPRDRTVLPNLLRALKSKQVVYFGDGLQRMDNTYVKNLAEGIVLAIQSEKASGQIFNITDGELVSKRKFISEVAKLAGYPEPNKSIPLWLAKGLAVCVTFVASLIKTQNPPLISMARYKFLGLDLGFSIKKARKVLNYQPSVKFAGGMNESIKWFKENGLLP